MIYDLIIVGGGAAGLFAAANVLPETKCLLLEKGAVPGKKLLLAGSGQANITHGGNIRDFLTHYGSNGKAIRSVLYSFNNKAVIDFFTSRGVKLIERDDGKVFPATLSSRDILDVLLRASKQNGVEIKCQSPVTKITPTDLSGKPILDLSEYNQSEMLLSITGGGQKYLCKNAIICAGGKSYPQTGSDGSIVPILQALSQPIVPQRPALAPIFTDGYPYGSLSGISFSDILVSAVSSGSSGVIRKRGDVLFTHKGFSGPAVLSLSRYVAEGDSISLSYLQTTDTSQVYTSIYESSKGNSKRLVTVISDLYGDKIPSRFFNILCELSGINISAKASTIPGSSIKRLASLLTDDIHKVSSVGGYNMAMVTAGGVSLDCINTKTLQSKIFANLYFAGEILDVDGDTGGYNLQFAFSSGYVASKLTK